MLRTPGHTPGPTASLLVKLTQMGPVILTPGDAVHFRENYDSDGVPSFNYDRAETVASIERIKKIAANLKATVILRARRARRREIAGIPGVRQIVRGSKSLTLRYGRFAASSG